MVVGGGRSGGFSGCCDSVLLPLGVTEVLLLLDVFGKVVEILIRKTLSVF